MTCKIALTGATGWFGQTFIKQYIKKYSLELAKKNLFLLSSNGRQLKIPNIDHTFNTIALENIDQLENIDILIHSAFLTKDKIEAISADRFLVINRKITDKVVGFSINKKIKKIFIISSGSARNHDEAGNIYGFLKKREEDLFLSIDFSKITVFRVFGASGSLMPNIEWSALASFIAIAMKKKNIKVAATGRVERSYVSFDVLSNLIISLLKTNAIGSNEIVDACSVQTDIHSLAKIVAKNFEVSYEDNNYNPLVLQHSYIGDSKNFIDLCKKNDIELPTIEEQIFISSNSPFLDV